MISTIVSLFGSATNDVNYDEKKNDMDAYDVNHENAFAEWFDEFGHLSRLMNDTVVAAKLETAQQVDSDEKTEKKDSIGGNENENEEAEETSINFMKMIIDGLGLNHIKLNNSKINEEFLCCLGNSQSLGEERMKEIKYSIYNTFVSKMIKSYYNNMKNDNMDGSVPVLVTGNPTCEDDDDDCNDDTSSSSSELDSIDFQTYLDYFLNDKNNKTKHLDGFMMNSSYLRTIVDGIKCRSNIDALLDFNFGPENEFQINKSQLIVLLLEISEESIHKKIISSAIEQRIPIPILYPMVQATTITTSKINIDNKNNKDNYNKCMVTPDCYMRDILHLTSQSKVISDGMNQTSIGRDCPLVMFLGSNEVKGKSSFLKEMFDPTDLSLSFNITSHSGLTPLHLSSVDLIHLPKQYETNYHILDVHGRINDPLISKCTNNKMTRLDLLVSLAFLCHCIVIQINKSEFRSKSLKKCDKNNFVLTDLINQKKNKAKEIIEFYEKLKVWLLLHFFSAFVFVYFFEIYKPLLLILAQQQ